jgi:hypothetical protein
MLEPPAPRFSQTVKFLRKFLTQLFMFSNSALFQFVQQILCRDKKKCELEFEFEKSFDGPNQYLFLEIGNFLFLFLGIGWPPPVPDLLFLFLDLGNFLFLFLGVGWPPPVPDS